MVAIHYDTIERRCKKKFTLSNKKFRSITILQIKTPVFLILYIIVIIIVIIKSVFAAIIIIPILRRVRCCSSRSCGGC